MRNDKKKKTKLDKRIYSMVLIAFIIGAAISIVSSYAIAETLIKSADVSYVDNSKLGATNVQAAIDGTCTKFSNDLATLQTTIINKIYPVGSIYISYSSTNPSSFLGGTWEAFGKGQTLVGIDTSQTEFNTVGKTGGEKVHTLTIDEMPSHNHVVSPVGDSTIVPGGFGSFDDYTHTFRLSTNSGGHGGNTRDTGGSQAHNNLQPYITVYMWKRKA